MSAIIASSIRNKHMTLLAIENIEISDKAEDLLEWVFDTEDDNNRDPRGFYAEFESEDCKPWKPMHVAELIEAGLVSEHAESDYIPRVEEIQQAEEYDSDEKWGGVAFLSLTKRGEEYIQANGLMQG
jgi:hypothetical protein